MTRQAFAAVGCAGLIAFSQPAAGAEASRCLAFSELLEVSALEPATSKQLAAARRSVASRPREAGPFGRLGILLEAHSRFEAAAACYEEAVQRAPESFRWRYLLGTAQSFAGLHEEAIANLERAVRIDPTYAPASLRLAEMLLRAGESERSLETARDVASADPAMPQAHYAVGQALAAMEEWTPALEAFERACELLPHYAAAHYARAQTLRRAGDREAARKALARYQQLRSLPPPEASDPLRAEIVALHSGARAHVARGSVAARNGDFETAVEEFEAALEINPETVVAHSNLIVVYGEIERFDDAERHYRAALEISPSSAEAHYNWGAILARRGLLEAAARAFRQALELNPHYAEARVQLGLTLDDRERFDEAEAQYRQALESNPLHPQAHYQLGSSLLRKGRVEEGLAELEHALGPGAERSAAYLEALAEAHESEGNLRAALWYAKRGRQAAEKFGQGEFVERFDERIRRLEGRQ